MCPSARAGRRAHRAAAVARLGGLGLGLGVAMSCRASALIDVMSAACLTLSPAPAESPLPPAPRCCTLAAELCSSSSSLTRRAVHGGCSPSALPSAAALSAALHCLVCRCKQSTPQVSTSARSYPRLHSLPACACTLAQNGNPSTRSPARCAGDVSRAQHDHDLT